MLLSLSTHPTCYPEVLIAATAPTAVKLYFDLKNDSD